MDKYRTLQKLIDTSSDSTQRRVKRILCNNYNLRGTVNSVYQLTPGELDTNIKVYELEKINEEKLKGIYSLCSRTYLPIDVIYKSSQNKVLTMGEILNIAKCAFDVVDILGFDVGKVSSAITGLKILNRLSSDENISRKDISLLAEIFGEYAKYYTENEEEKKKITITTATFAMINEFLQNQ